MAATEKARYVDEMKDYVVPEADGDDSDDNAGKKKAKSAKQKKDPNAPKKPLSSYMLFSNHIRSSIKDDNPDIKFGDMAKAVAEKYKKLNDKERAKWNEKADTEKKRYEQEMEAYKKKKATDINDEDDEDDDDE